MFPWVPLGAGNMMFPYLERAESISVTSLTPFQGLKVLNTSQYDQNWTGESIGRGWLPIFLSIKVVFLFQGTLTPKAITAGLHPRKGQ